MGAILKTININKYFLEPVKFHVLKNISIGLEEGEFVSIMGKSGCGKSTLLYILSTMDTQYEGELIIDGEIMTQLSNPSLAKVRNEKIGFIFQFHYLLPEFTVLKNVMLPALKLGKESESIIKKKALEKLGGEAFVSSTKAGTGHLLGAAGALEAGIALLSLVHQVVPPTLHLFKPEPDVGLNHVKQVARPVSLERVLSLSYGFGGQMGAVQFSRD